MDFFFFIAVLAGIFTVLAPCIFPFLPIVIGASQTGKRGISRRALVVIGSLSVSVIAFTLLLKTSTLLISIPQVFWNVFSGSIIVLVGLALLFPNAWARIPLVQQLSQKSDQALDKGLKKKSYSGDVLVGFALGPVFTTCSPTYLFIIATLLPAGFITGIVYLLGFTAGLAFSLLVIAFFGQVLVSKISKRMRTANTIKKVFAILIILVGLSIMTGVDKDLQTRILDSGYGATISLEEKLIEQYAPSESKTSTSEELLDQEIVIPAHLQRAFPDTDFTQADRRIQQAISGGPGKDGIPSINEPTFTPLKEFVHSDSVQAIVLIDADMVKVYPYNILVWHEIVNDIVGGVPVAVTFCPLCGSAIVFDRRVESRTLSFGVSGSLFESNMIMHDRETQTLWQQSTGDALAGELFGTRLSLVEFQLLTISQIKQLYPDALVLSEKTGHNRDYARNPYAGYEESDTYVFSPSVEDEQYHSKDIFVVFRVEEKIVGFPYHRLGEGELQTITIHDTKLSVQKTNGEISIMNEASNSIPFYFEMWFSFIVQHGDDAIVIDFET